MSDDRGGMMHVGRIGDLGLLALVIWREARGEPPEGKLAVAHVVMERTRRPNYRDSKGYTWGDGTVLSALFSPWQFSSVTDPKDPQLTRWPKDDLVWDDCVSAATWALLGMKPHPMPGADSYHDVSIPEPKAWEQEKTFVGQIGRLKFYHTK